MNRMLTVVAVLGCAFAAPLHAETELVSAGRPATSIVEMRPSVYTMQPIPDPDEMGTVSIDGPETELAKGKHTGARDCLATAIYFEARGESLKGQRAVGEVILARTRQAGRPKSVCGVVYEGSHRRTGCQFSFTCDGIADVVRNTDAWARAQRAAALVISSPVKRKVARGATHYHATSVRPYWASSLRKVARIGSHIFYR
jgi:spore germination cell wall hydrolase CwlJ-like protein